MTGDAVRRPTYPNQRQIYIARGEFALLKSTCRAEQEDLAALARVDPNHLIRDQAQNIVFDLSSQTCEVPHCTSPKESFGTVAP